MFTKQNIWQSLRHFLGRAIPLLIGLALLSWVVYWVQWNNLKEALTGLSAWVWMLPAAYLFMTAWDILGWRIIFPSEIRKQMKFRSLFMIHTACQAINNITPFVDVGGEFLKVHITARRYTIAKKQVLSSIVIQRTMLFVSENFFWTIGLLPIFFLWKVPPRYQVILGAGAALFAALGILLIWAQKKGFFLTLLNGLRFVGIRSESLKDAGASLAEVDDDMRRFYNAGDGRWFTSLLLHLGGWAAGGLEVYLIFLVLGHPITLIQGMMIEALVQLIRTVSFYIPGNLGAQEGGLALVAQWMGFNPAAGVLLSLLKRYRHLVWTVIGFALWFVIEWRSKNSSNSKKGIHESSAIPQTP